MLDLSVSSEREAIESVCSGVADDVIDPAAAEADRAGTIPSSVWSALLELGLTAAVSTEHGGGGVPDPVDQLVAIERLAWGDPGIVAASVWHGHAVALLDVLGTDQQRDAWLPRLTGDPATRAGCAIHEGYGRAPSEYRTSITPGGGRAVTRGRKVAVPFARMADLVIVVGTDSASGALRAVLVRPKDLTVETQTAGGLALDAAQLCSVTIDLASPDTALLGGPGCDAEQLGRLINRCRLALGAIQLGGAERSLAYAADYAGERVAFGRPIAAFQGVSFPLAEARMRIAAARLELWDTAAEVATRPLDELERSVANSLSYCGDVAATTTRDALQVLGGHGFITDHPIERWYRAAGALSTIDLDPTVLGFAAAL